MTAAVVYMRCSSRGQDSGDTWDRQLAAVKLYAETHNIEIVDEYRDVITGKTDLDDRPGLAACLERVENNGVKLVLIESADRLARDAMVLELSIREFKKYGATVMTASGVAVWASGAGSRVADGVAVSSTMVGAGVGVAVLAKRLGPRISPIILLAPTGSFTYSPSSDEEMSGCQMLL